MSLGGLANRQIIPRQARRRFDPCGVGDVLASAVGIRALRRWVQTVLLGFEESIACG